MVSRKPRFRPMGIGDIFDEAFELYKSNFLLLASIAAVLYMPVQFLASYLTNRSVMTMSMGTMNPDAAFSNMFETLIAVYVRYAIVLLIFPLIAGSFTYGISRRFTGEESTLKEALGFVFRRFGAVYLTGLIVMLMLILPNLAVVAGVYWGWHKFGQYALLGIVLFVPSGVLSIFLSIKTMFAATAVVVEEKKYFRAIARSWQLSKGHFWRIFLIMALFTLIAYVLQAIISMPISIVASISFISTAMEGKNPSMVPLIIMGALQAIITGVITPIVFVVNVLLYYDVRIRKEGFDLQMLARELASSSGSAYSSPPAVETHPFSESENNDAR